MAKKTANIIVRIEPEVKAEAEEVLDDLGISLSAAVNLFLKQLIRTGGIPFEINSRREDNETVKPVSAPKETVVEMAKPKVEPKEIKQEEITQEKTKPEVEEQEIPLPAEEAPVIVESKDENEMKNILKNDYFAFPEKLSKILTVIKR